MLDEPVKEPQRVPVSVEEVKGLSLTLVEDPEHRAVWNTLLDREHPNGTTMFAGAQIRYLVSSEHGYLGAVGFSACALRLRCRDQWMAWSSEQRESHLNRVLCLSRFLIRPGVQCRNLASCVLGMVLEKLRVDFEARYDYKPWLVETYVDSGWKGTCFKAANFKYIGQTAGRGRQDRYNKRAKTVKSVYIYELVSEWRKLLGVVWACPGPSSRPTAAYGRFPGVFAPGPMPKWGHVSLLAGRARLAGMKDTPIAPASMDVIPLAKLAQELDIDRSTLRKWVRRQGLESMLARFPETRGQLALAFTPEQAGKVIKARQDEGYGRNGVT